MTVMGIDLYLMLMKVWFSHFVCKLWFFRTGPRPGFTNQQGSTLA